jgi:two-component system chemotaxis response regulator CheY
MEKEDVNVLIVDDVKTMRIQLKDLLKSFGYKKITTAGSGEEAKTFFVAEKFNLILSDWHMSPGSGLDLLKYVRSQPELKSTPFILITAEGTKDNVVDAIGAGVDDYLVKPITMEQLSTKVNSLLAKKQVIS